ncbi:hypothetical protein OHB54_30250 [Streptomyces sp. NBC_01007]|nr:hypothetical protein OHB54_30250 [Streptomyces sp. NBC_01007]
MVRIRRARKVVLAVALQAATLALQVAVQDDLTRTGTGTWVTRLAFLAPVPFLLYVIWRLRIGPYVSFGQDRLLVNNMYTQYLIPYHLITELKGWTALNLEISGYGRLRVDAFGAALTGRAQRDAVAEKLLRRRDAAVPVKGHGLEKRSTVGLPEWLGPVLSLTLFATAGLLSAVG